MVDENRRRRRSRRGVVFVSVVAVVVVVATQRGSVSNALARVGRVSAGWLAAAVMAEVLSYVAMAELQRHLLAVAGVRLRHRSVVALAWASDAVSASVPVGGPASAIYTFRHLTRRGATPGLAVWAMAASGLLSSSALVSVGLLGVELRRPVVSGVAARMTVSAGAVLIVAVVVIAVVVWASARPSRLQTLVAGFGPAIRLVGRLARRPWASYGSAPDAPEIAPAEPIIIGRRAAIAAFVLAVVNWIADGVALALSLMALGAAVPVCSFVLAYALAQLAANVPLLPGALGVAEGSLALALMCAGVPPADALAGALIYRFVSYWLQLPAGWAMWAALRRGGGGAPAEDAALRLAPGGSGLQL